MVKSSTYRQHMLTYNTKQASKQATTVTGTKSLHVKDMPPPGRWVEGGGWRETEKLSPDSPCACFPVSNSDAQCVPHTENSHCACACVYVCVWWRRKIERKIASPPPTPGPPEPRVVAIHEGKKIQIICHTVNEIVGSTTTTTTTTSARFRFWDESSHSEFPGSSSSSSSNRLVLRVEEWIYLIFCVCWKECALVCFKMECPRVMTHWCISEQDSTENSNWVERMC